MQNLYDALIYNLSSTPTTTTISDTASILTIASIIVEIILIILIIAACIAIFSIRNSVKTIEEMYYNFNKDEFNKRNQQIADNQDTYREKQ